MTHLQHTLVSFLLLGITVQLQAQESVNSSAGIALGAGGEAHFSIGQSFYHKITDAHLNYTEGVHQPIEDRAAYTLIPDANFEQRLINLGIDTDGIPGKVLTESILPVKDLNLSDSEITDLTGIQDFAALSNLYCPNNNLSALDLSGNVILETVNCANNSIASLDFSSNMHLKDMNCSVNSLSALNLYNTPYLKKIDFSFNNTSYLDLSSNQELVSVFGFGNQLEGLDVSNNPALVDLGISENKLAYLNLQNGNNDLLNVNNLRLNNNPDLTCILVDSKSYADLNWTGVLKDETATYSEECTTLSNEDFRFSNLEIYPNPTRGVLHINNVELNAVAVYNVIGSLVLQHKFEVVSTHNTIDLSGLAKGVYVVTLKSKETTSTRKVIVE
jgi:hypothetical protein